MSTLTEWNVYEKVKDKIDTLGTNYVKEKGLPLCFFLA